MPRQSKKPRPPVFHSPEEWLRKPIGDLPRAWLDWLAQEATAETEPEMDLLEDLPPHPIRSSEWNPQPRQPPQPLQEDLDF